MRDSTDDFRTDMVHLESIVAMLPNLSILTFDIRGHGYSSCTRIFPSSILQSTSENLNVVCWYSSYTTPEVEDWVEFLSSRPHLRSISDLAQPYEGPFITTVVNFPSLTSLHLSQWWSAEYLSRMELPHLQHLTYRAGYDFTEELAQFLQNHGARLMSFTTDCRASEWNILPLLSATCPNLISLELTIDVWDSLPDNRSALAPIRTMKLACRWHKHGRRLYRRLFAFIIDITTVCPTLKTIQFADERSICNLNKHLRVLQGQLEILSEAGVTLENADGRLIALS